MDSTNLRLHYMKNKVAFPLCSGVTVEPQKPTRALFPKGTDMERFIPINDLGQLSDAYLLWCREIEGQEGALLFLVSPRAYTLVFGPKRKTSSYVFIPMDNIDPLVNMFDESGLDLSYG